MRELASMTRWVAVLVRIRKVFAPTTPGAAGAVNRFRAGWHAPYGPRYLVCGWAFALAVTPLAARPADIPSLEELGCTTPVRIAMSRNVIFYRQGFGIDPDLLAALSQLSGCQFDKQVLPRGEIWRRIQQGRLDMATSAIATDELRHYGFFIPYLYVRTKLILRADLAEWVQTFQDFYGLPDAKLGEIRGSYHGAYLRPMLRLLYMKGRFVEYNNDPERFAALYRGDVDAVVGHELSLDYNLADPGSRQAFRVLDVVPGASEAHSIVLSRRRFTPAQSAAWQRLFDRLVVSGEWEKLVRRNVSANLVNELLSPLGPSSLATAH